MRASIAEVPEDLNREKLGRKQASINKEVLGGACNTFEAFLPKLERWIGIKGGDISILRLTLARRRVDEGCSIMRTNTMYTIAILRHEPLDCLWRSGMGG